MSAVTTTDLLKRAYAGDDFEGRPDAEGTLPQEGTTTAELVRRAYAVENQNSDQSEMTENITSRPENQLKRDERHGSDRVGEHSPLPAAETTTELVKRAYGSEKHGSSRVGERSPLSTTKNALEDATAEALRALEDDAVDGDTVSPAEDPTETPLASQEEQEDEERLLPREAPVSTLDLVGLDRERFVQEQSRTPWIQALKAFLQDGALALGAQLRARTLQMAPHYGVANGVL